MEDDNFAEGLSMRATWAIRRAIVYQFTGCDWSLAAAYERNGLLEAQRITAENVAALEYENLRRTENCGAKTIAEIRAKLATRGLDVQNAPTGKAITHCPTCGKKIDRPEIVQETKDFVDISLGKTIWTDKDGNVVDDEE